MAPDSVQHVLVEVVMALEHIGTFGSFESEWQRSLLGISAGEARQWATLLLFAFSGGTTSSEAVAKRLKADPVYRSLGGPRPASLEELRAFRAQHREALASIFSEILETLSACGLTRLRQCELRTIAQAEGRSARLEASRSIGEALLDAEGDTSAAAEGRTTSDALPDAMRDRASRHQRIAEVVTQRQAGETGQRWDELTQLIDLASIDGDLSDPLTRSTRPSTGEFAELEQLFLEADLPLDGSGADNAEDDGLFGRVDDFTLGEVEYRGDVGASDAARLSPAQVPTSPASPPQSLRQRADSASRYAIRRSGSFPIAEIRPEGHATDLTSSRAAEADRSATHHSVTAAAPGRLARNPAPTPPQPVVMTPRASTPNRSRSIASASADDSLRSTLLAAGAVAIVIVGFLVYLITS